jgi:hypothetical protein
VEAAEEQGFPTPLRQTFRVEDSIREAPEEAHQGNLHFQAGQPHAQAGVGAGGERNVLLAVAADVEAVDIGGDVPSW